MSTLQETPPTKTRQSARVFMGPITSREANLDAMEIQSMHDWRKRFETEYLERVKVRAAAYVQTMYEETSEKNQALRQNTEDWVKKREGAIDKTYEDAIGKHQTSETLLQQAQERYDTSLEEGYKHGVEKAMLEMEEHRHELDTAYVSVLRAIEEQCDNIFATWRQDLVSLLIDSVEASISWTLTKDRRQTFEALFDNAVHQLTDQRRLRVKVHPDDATLVQDVLHQAKTRFPELRSWNVDVSAEITPGSLSVESHTGRADNNIQYRLAKLQEILQYLELPEGEAETNAKEAIAKVDAEAGIPVLVEAVNARMPDPIPEETVPEIVPEQAFIADDNATNPEENTAPTNPTIAETPDYTPDYTADMGEMSDMGNMGDTAAVENTLQDQQADFVEPLSAEDSSAENIAAATPEAENFEATSETENLTENTEQAESAQLPTDVTPNATPDALFGEMPAMPETVIPDLPSHNLEQNPADVQMMPADNTTGINPLRDLEDELLQDLESSHVAPFMQAAVPIADEAQAQGIFEENTTFSVEQQASMPDLSNIETVETIEAFNAQHNIINEENA